MIGVRISVSWRSCRGSLRGLQRSVNRQRKYFKFAHVPGPLDSEGVSCCYKVIYGRFHYYPTLGVRTMTDQEDQLLKETKRAEKRAAEDIEQLARDQARRKANLAREQAIAEDQKEKETKRAEKRTAEDIEQLARDQARKKANLAREQAIEEAQEARKFKAKKETRE